MLMVLNRYVRGINENDRVPVTVLVCETYASYMLYCFKKTANFENSSTSVRETH